MILVWGVSTDGRFTIKSAWDLCRTKCSSLALSKMMWHSNVPLKWSFLTWRDVRGGFPLDLCIQKGEINLASKCNCCVSPSRENVDHGFVNSDVAKGIRADMEQKMGIHSVVSSLKLKLNRQWLASGASPC